MPDQLSFDLATLKRGDLVLLRWTGDRRVPHREGDSWAVVDEARDSRVVVMVCSYGTTRYITADHIKRVDRKVGRNTYERAADRVQISGGTRLVSVEAH